MKKTYATALARTKTASTPQNQPIPGRENEMAQNHAGGVVFTLTPFKTLERFLILGSDSPTYYASSQKLTKDSAANIRKCLETDGKKTVDMIVEISQAGRAPSNDPALFALAVASTPDFGSAETAQYATSQLSKVARTGTHLMHYAEYVSSMRGWGRNLKNAFGTWFTEKKEEQLAYQLAKYQQRDGWSTKDLLRLAHPKTTDPRKSALLAWATVGGVDALRDQSLTWNREMKSKKQYVLTPGEVSTRRNRFESAYSILTGPNANKLIAAFEAAKKATTTKEIVKLIREGGLTHEMIPTQFKTEPEVWAALLEKMPLTAMVRNLGVMTKVGLLKPLSEASKLVVDRLNDQQYIQKSRLHPLQILLASGTYRQGHGARGSSTWNAVPTVVDALEGAFYKAFANVVPTGKAIYIGLDVSGSMGWSFIGATGISAAQAGAAMALVVARTESNYAFFGFCHQMVDLGITKSDTLETAMRKTAGKNFGSTDCAQPMIHAKNAGLSVDSFITITDNETWAGNIQPIQALKQYRTYRGKQDVSAVVMGMVASSFTIADPKDPYNLDVVGFDANVPVIIADFIRGKSTGVIENTDLE